MSAPLAWFASIALALANPAGPPSPMHPGARAGEAFTFKFSVGPIESGRARMAVGRPFQRRGRRLMVVRGDAGTLAWLALVARMKDDYRLTIDPSTLLPVDLEEIENGVRDRKINTTFDGRGIEQNVVGKQGSGHLSRRLSEFARDPLSALFALRAAPLSDGETLGFDVLDGMALWRVRSTVKRGETLRIGELPRATDWRAIRIESATTRIDDAGRPVGQPPRQVVVWLSDDANRVVLRVEAETDLGRATIELTSYTPPRRTADLAPALTGVRITH